MLKRAVLLVFLFMLALNHTGIGQGYQAQRNQIAAYNVLFNGLIGGISGTLHKNKGEKVLPVFLKNFGKGCLGGLIKYSAKNQTYYLKSNSNIYFAPINRAFFFLGHSLVTNASRNLRTLENYHCNLYGVDFDYSPYKELGNRLKVRASLGTTISLISFLGQGHKLNFYKTLEYGLFYFDMDSTFNRKGTLISGTASHNVMAIKKFSSGRTAQSVIPHELVHTFQHYDFFPLSNLYKKDLEHKLNTYATYNKLSRFIHFDYEALFFRSLYAVQPKPKYYRNFFEFEAQHFSIRRYIER